MRMRASHNRSEKNCYESNCGACIGGDKLTALTEMVCLVSRLLIFDFIEDVSAVGQRHFITL